jgi:hypothetical protein
MGLDFVSVTVLILCTSDSGKVIGERNKKTALSKGTYGSILYTH